MRRRPAFLVVVVLVLALLVTYLGDRLVPDAWPAWAIALAWSALAALVAVPLALLVRGARRVAAVMAPVGLFIFLLTFTALRDVAWLLVWLVADPPAGAFDISSGAVVTAALATYAFAALTARAGPRVVDVEVPVAGLHPALEGFTIAQLSDVHIGHALRRPFLERVVAQVNALDADLVAITGDLVDGGVPELREHTAPLAGLQARHGAWFVTGNHDYYAGALAWLDELERLGVRALVNAHEVLDHDGAPLVVAGVTDHTAHGMVPGHATDPHAAARGAPEGAFKLLLAHQPASALEAERAGFHLQLSGHTHGGQFFPGTLFAHLVFPHVAGLARRGGLWIYTSRGTGWVGAPLRTVAGEITRLVLVRA